MDRIRAGQAKSGGEIHCFNCALHAIVRDGAVQGISGLAKDITDERENEKRFTDLFQSLREGVYLASAEDRITEANPALAQMLGFPDPESLLNVEIASVYRDAADRAGERGKLMNTVSCRRERWF